MSKKKVARKVEAKIDTQPNTTKVISYQLDRNIKCGGVRYKKWHNFNEFDDNFNIFKNFTVK